MTEPTLATDIATDMLGTDAARIASEIRSAIFPGTMCTWEAHVPDAIAKRWSSLHEEARVIAYYYAHELLNNEEWE